MRELKKRWYTVASQAKGKQEKEKIDFVKEEKEEIVEIKEQLVDRKLGLQYCSGLDEMYWEFLKMFCEMREEKQNNIRAAFENKDWKNYTIYVHALKSTSLSIGGKKLSDLAKEIEYAGKDGRIEFIQLHHEALLKLYDETVNECLQYLE